MDRRNSGSWLVMLTFCATIALVIAFGLSILVASATLAFSLADSNSNAETADSQIALPAAVPQVGFSDASVIQAEEIPLRLRMSSQRTHRRH